MAAGQVMAQKQQLLALDIKRQRLREAERVLRKENIVSLLLSRSNREMRRGGGSKMLCGLTL